MLFSVLTIRKPLKSILQLDLDEIFLNDKIDDTQTEKIKKWEWVLFGGSIYVLLFTFIEYNFISTFSFDELYEFPTLFLVLTVCAIPFLPIFPIAFPLSLIKISLKYLDKKLKLVLNWVQRKKSQQFHLKMIIWKFIKDVKQNREIIEIFSISAIKL